MLLYSADLGGQIRDRLHHGVPDAGIVQRMAGAVDDTNFGLRPSRAQAHARSPAGTFNLWGAFTLPKRQSYF